MKKRALFSSLFIVAVLVGCITEGNPYSRIDSNQFQVAVKSFVPSQGKGPRITLLGTIHLGEANYYQEQQRILDSADLVLYENIKISDEERKEILRDCPENYDAGGGHSEAADMLDLTTQTTNIKNGKHFIHADITATELLDLSNAPKSNRICERLTTPLITLPGPTAAELKKIPSDVKRSLVALLLTKDLSFRPENENETTRIILFHRNKVAFGALETALTFAPPNKHIVVYYGAAHMPDLENSLLKKGYQLDDTKWLSAFSL